MGFPLFSSSLSQYAVLSVHVSTAVKQYVCFEQNICVHVVSNELRFACLEWSAWRLGKIQAKASSAICIEEGVTMIIGCCLQQSITYLTACI